MVSLSCLRRLSLILATVLWRVWKSFRVRARVCGKIDRCRRAPVHTIDRERAGRGDALLPPPTQALDRSFPCSRVFCQHLLTVLQFILEVVTCKSVEYGSQTCCYYWRFHNWTLHQTNELWFQELNDQSKGRENVVSHAWKWCEHSDW